jgi:hypothetical protein
MALDARRRQKKAEKRRAKAKAKRKQLASRRPDDIGQRLARVASAPILHSCTMQSLWDDGIAQVLVSRELDSGMVAFSAFLVDRYCLGVKDVFCDFLPRSEYFDQIYERVAATGDVVKLEPAAARKLVEGAAEYAAGLGLSAHPGYTRARQIFGAIDPAASDREFEFGKDGKPLFISGPRDSPGRCASIVGILGERLGPGNFDYVVHLSGMSPGGLDLIGLADDEELDEDGYDELAHDEFANDEDGLTIDGSAVEHDDPPHFGPPGPHSPGG